LSLVQLLFGELASSSLTVHSAFLQRAGNESAKRRKTSSDLAFGAYLIARLIETLLDLDETADSHAGFRWQMDATTRYVRNLPQDEPEANHLSGILEATTLDPGRRPALALSLTAYACFLEHEGRLEEALCGLALSARAHGAELPATELANYGLFAARLNRLLARWDHAVICYEAAELAAREQGDFMAALRGRLGQGAVARGQGNLPKARAIADKVVAEAVARGLPQVQCIAYADLSAVFTMLRMPLEAIHACYAAFLVATTPIDRMHALCNLGACLSDIEAHDQARLALDIAANAKADFRVQLNAKIELMNLESVVGNRLAFERHRAALASESMPPSAAADYHFKLGIGFARFGQYDRAIETLARARELAETHALNAWYFRIDNVLNDLKARRAVETKARAPAELKQAPLVLEVELGLRDYAAVPLE
jgi:tetratricopeptide (TPR) repeat protein